MSNSADFVIIGGGLYGSITAYHLAKNGAKNIVVLERNEICSGGTPKSCAIVRTHYSIEANLVHAVESLKVFANFDDAIGGDCGWQQTGYLILGPEAHREPMQQVFRTQNEHGVDTRVLAPEEVKEIHPLVNLDGVGVIGFDTLTGYCDPYATTAAYADRARELGVTIQENMPVTGLQFNGNKTVETPSGTFESPAVIIANGPWAQQIGAMVGLKFPYEVSRHKVLNLKTEQPYEEGWPIVKDLTTPDKLYFRPDEGGTVLIGTGDHGDPIDDADTLTDDVEAAHIERIKSIIARRMPAFIEAECTDAWTGPYDITPDWNPLVGEVPEHEGLYIATGFSGHGFKLAPTIGESLAQIVLGLEPRLPIDMYDMHRFAEGKTLHGAYGIGSIS